ncbi:MAG TPA: hypothetical protein VGX37_07500 [Allosphingosinicella sp.]|jgi:hypothetical protein|nr:hypothetical protein [Allosphingosinicella sp.]
MHLIGLSILIQIACAVHCVRTGRNGLWLMVIIFLSIPGCLAYSLFEILPQYSGRREVRAVKAAAARALNPERDLKAAREALEISDTAANRIALGDALGELGRWAEAAGEYAAAAAKSPLPERATQLKLAQAQLESGRHAKARELLEQLPASGSQAENDRSALLLARALEQEGETERALQLYGELGARMPGGEALCRQAALLLTQRRRAEALSALGEVERRLKRIDRFERAAHADMYEWAARTLGELRAGQVGG